MEHIPPTWADRFLEWYCNPTLLEEIQGDAYELYFDRLKRNGKVYADLWYTWDVIRFFRWSNIRRKSENSTTRNWRTILNFNLKMALRNAVKNKITFTIKTVGLSICTAFTMLLLAYVINEISYDKFHVNHDRIYRVTSNVNFEDHNTHYAVTPLPLGQTLTESIPGIENYTRFMYEDKPIYFVDGQSFYNEITLAADSNFLKVFTFNFIQGGATALNQPNKIVLTESLAIKFFGDTDVIGRTIKLGQDGLVEVAAILKDVPTNSHLKFDGLISWDTYSRDDDWGNLNAYTYILLKPKATIEEVKSKMSKVLSSFHDRVERQYKASFEPRVEKLTDIHFSDYLDEDIAEKKNKNNLLLLVAVIILFSITGLINYLNLTLAEHSANFKKIGILKIFGGVAGSHNKTLFYDTLLTLAMVAPLVSILCYIGWHAGNTYFSIHLDQAVWTNPLFISITSGFLFMLVASSQLNAAVLSKAENLFHAAKGKLNAKQSGTRLRKILVAVQVSFSIIMIALIFITVDQFNYIRESDKGFDDKNMLVVKLRSNEHVKVETFNETVRKLVGVSNVGGSSYFPGALETKYVFQVETEKGMEELLVSTMQCGYDLLDALSIKVAHGRKFKSNNAKDRYGSFIINETAARQFGWKDALGKKIRGPIGGAGEPNREGDVIGVVKDFNFGTLHTKIEPLILFLTDEEWGSQFIYIKKTPIHPADLLLSIEKKFKAQWPGYPFEWEYLDSKYISLYKKDYEVKNIFETGLIISILISCLGIFSVSALLASMRRKEMGIRKVVGATPRQLFFLHIQTFLHFMVISILVAWPLTWYFSDKWLENFAYHITLNVWYFILPVCIASLIILVTAGYHGIKSALVNPVDNLKQE